MSCAWKTTGSPLCRKLLIGDSSRTEREHIKASLAHPHRLIEGELEDRNIFVRAPATQQPATVATMVLTGGYPKLGATLHTQLSLTPGRLSRQNIQQAKQQGLGGHLRVTGECS